MFKIIPSITISQGQVVKAQDGNFEKLLKYEHSPVDVARQFEDHGMKVLHFVDLDGAKKGSPVNYHVMEAIAGHTELKVDFSGGIRTDGDINKVLEYGATFFTVASISVEDPELFTSWMFSYGREKIALSADVIDKQIHVKGWQKKTDISLFDHVDYFYNRGLKYLKVIDIKREGKLEGPNFELYKEVVERYPNACIAAVGGIESIDNIVELKKIGLYAAIVGRALYEDKISLKELEKLNEG